MSTPPTWIDANTDDEPVVTTWDYARAVLWGLLHGASLYALLVLT